MYARDGVVSDRRTLQPFCELDWLNAVLNGGIRRGAAYLLTGPPGSNKTTLCVQAAVDLALQGCTVVFLLSEQTPEEAVPVFARVVGSDLARLPSDVQDNVSLHTFESPADLPGLIRSGRLGSVAGIDLIVVDSLQGGGLLSSSVRAYRPYYEFADHAKRHGVATLTTAHVTKSGKTAGPKTLEHKVDVSLVLGKAGNYRPFYLAKNRFGPELADPIMLESASSGLILSPHRLGQTASVLGYPGEGDQVVEVQASVGLPRFGACGEITAPFLHGKRIRQIVSTLAKLPGLDLNHSSYVVNALAPDMQGYAPAMDLAIAMAILAAYLQQPIPPRTVFVGSLDLRLHIRTPGLDYLSALGHLLDGIPGGSIRRVHLSMAAAGLLAELRHAPPNADEVQIVGVRTLEDLLDIIWPGVIGKAGDPLGPAAHGEL